MGTEAAAGREKDIFCKSGDSGSDIIASNGLICGMRLDTVYGCSFAKTNYTCPLSLYVDARFARIRKHTTAGIRWWSPTQLLTGRRVA